MGYFPNGTEILDYQAQYCERCINDVNGDCPVLLLHLLWNYDAVGKDKDETKEAALNTFIPRGELSNEQCKMFVQINGKDR